MDTCIKAHNLVSGGEMRWRAHLRWFLGGALLVGAGLLWLLVSIVRSNPQEVISA